MNTNRKPAYYNVALAVMANDWLDDHDGAWFQHDERGLSAAVRSCIRRGLAEPVPCDAKGEHRARLTPLGVAECIQLGQIGVQS